MYLAIHPSQNGDNLRLAAPCEYLSQLVQLSVITIFTSTNAGNNVVPTKMHHAKVEDCILTSYLRRKLSFAEASCACSLGWQECS